MNNFLNKIFGHGKFMPPENIQQRLLEKFPETVNVEWNKTGKNFEAIFYKDQLEYIAIIDFSGKLLEYKMSLSEDLLPQQIKENLLQKGEIMNAVLINKGNAISYEVIIRNKSLTRFMIILNETGITISERQL